MVYFIEGARNSGKTYISNNISSSLNLKRYQYEFSYWFKNMGIADNSKSAQMLAIGKESMLLQLIRDGLIKDKCIIDRGIFSVIAWGVLESRINDQEAKREIDSFIERGLMSNVEFIYVYGDNPDGDRKNKDYWDKNESTRNVEKDLMERYLNYTEDNYSNVVIHRIKNTFDNRSIETIKNIIK